MNLLLKVLWSQFPIHNTDEGHDKCINNKNYFWLQILLLLLLLLSRADLLKDYG